MSAEKYVSYHKRPDGIEYNADGSKFCSSAQLISSEVVPGAHHLSAVWYLSPGLHDIKTHTHEVGEIVGFIGSNPEDPDDLGGEMRFWIDGEWVTLTKSCFIYIPAGVEHCPYEFIRVDKPILHLSSLPVDFYKGTSTEGENIEFLPDAGTVK